MLDRHAMSLGWDDRDDVIAGPPTVWIAPEGAQFPALGEKIGDEWEPILVDGEPVPRCPDFAPADL